MKKTLLLFFLLFIFQIAYTQILVTEIGTLPVRVSNNAVCEGFIGDTPYLFSFAGIDSTKKFSGIHLKSYRHNLETGENLRLPDLPDERGKIACSASRIGNIIYISGGYYVFSDGSEISSDDLHRYDVVNNVFLEDAAPLPKSTDDHVQVVWRDSLLFLITGWSDTRNIPNVQIYNPSDNTWQAGTAIPNNNNYKSFGASGTILHDTIYYFGGASSGFGFNIQNQVRKGIINPDDPTQIDWSISTPDTATKGYRAACTTVYDELHWIGGGKQTYNYDGIAYNGSGGVAPTNRDLFTTPHPLIWEKTIMEEIPMDLRGIAKVNDTLQFLAGGMIANQLVTNKIYRLEWKNKVTSINNYTQPNTAFISYPNPFFDTFSIQKTNHDIRFQRVEIYDFQGKKLGEQRGDFDNLEFPNQNFIQGIYFLKGYSSEGIFVEKIVKN